MDALIQGRADCYGELACRPGAAEEQVVLSSGEDDAESLNSVATRSPTVRGFEEISTPNPSGFRLAADAVLALVAQLATNVEALRRVARFGSPPAADSTLGEVGGRKHRRNSNAWENALVSKV